MVRPHGDARQIGQRMIAEQAMADVGMGADHRIFVFGQTAGLVEDGVGYGDLAQVMQEAADHDACDVGGGQAAVFRQQAGKLRNAPQVAARVGVARLDHRGHGKQAFQQKLYGVHFVLSEEFAASG